MSPIGVWDDLAEDAKGLWGKGRLLKDDVQKARETHALMKAKAVTGLSIGYREVETEPEGNIRLLKKLDLMEISPVAFPANRRARITEVKSEEFAKRFREGTPPNIREFEEFLRDSGFPKSIATAIASRGYGAAIRSESDGERARKLALLRLQIATI
jgi:phage head maturation protease